MDWSSDIVLEFLYLYEQEAVIWNPKHASHRNRSEIGEAWKRIQDSISPQCSIEDLKRKKESLMATFRLLFNKVKESARTATTKSDIYKPNWFAYRTMERFLKNVYQPRGAANNEDDDNELQDDDMEVKEEVWFSQENADELNNSDDNPENEHSEPTPPPEQSNFKLPKTRRYKKRKWGNNNSLGEADETVKRMPVEAFYSPVEQNEKDDCVLYGELTARKLRVLDEKTREIVMNEIDNLLFRAKMGQGCQQSSPSHSFTGAAYSSPAHICINLPCHQHSPSCSSNLANNGGCLSTCSSSSIRLNSTQPAAESSSGP